MTTSGISSSISTAFIPRLSSMYVVNLILGLSPAMYLSAGTRCFSALLSGVSGQSVHFFSLQYLLRSSLRSCVR